MTNLTQHTVITLWPDGAPGSEQWTQQEQEIVSPETGMLITHNIAQPTLTAYLPDRGTANGTAVIVCPGGGFHYLEVEKEGSDMARWLNACGITAFVLRYRLIRTGDDFMAEMRQNLDNIGKMAELMVPMRPLLLADAQQAVRLVRQHAGEWGIKQNRIGIMGFSAGGTVTTIVALLHDAGSRPDFIAPIYSGPGAEVPVPPDAPPMFLVCADDDGLVPHTVRLYSDWKAAGRPVEMHIYSQGGHGFGLRPHGLPADTWTDRFGDWLKLQGLCG
jgi:acetyl esterase/lipase